MNPQRIKNARGGAAKNEDQDFYKYKAKKYHYKIQQKLKEMRSQGKTFPVEYEQYLKPFSV